MSVTTIPLSISSEYVPTWGEWECVREFIQNALDEEDTRITWEGNEIQISNKGTVERQHLLLGRTDKRGVAGKIGQHGEGLKLAFLVAARLGLQPLFCTGNEMWIPELAHSPLYNCEVLEVRIVSREGSPAEKFAGRTAVGLIVKDPALIKARYRPDLPLNTPLKTDDVKGHIFVQGLWVCHVKDMEYGYNFTKDRIDLDRDRGVVDGWRLEAATGLLWAQQEKGGLASALRGGRDTRGISWYPGHGQAIAREWDQEYAGVVPVSTQEEIQKAQSAGRKWKLVPQGLKDLLWAIRGFFLPHIGTPAERLNKWIEKHTFALDKSAVEELKDIARSLESTNVK